MSEAVANGSTPKTRETALPGCIRRTNRPRSRESSSPIRDERDGHSRAVEEDEDDPEPGAVQGNRADEDDQRRGAWHQSAGEAHREQATQP